MKPQGHLQVLDQKQAVPPSSAELIERSKANDRDAFRQLIERYQRLVGMIVFRLVPRREDAVDLCQDVFLKAFEHLGTYRGEAEFSTWIGRIAHHTAINYLRKKRVPSFSDLPQEEHRIQNTAHQEPGPEEHYQRDDRQSALEREMALLAETDRTLLTLFHQQGMNYEDIGRTLGMTVANVKSHLFRARKRLRERLCVPASCQEVS
jgi:RNA polymerase sigma-70 factor (ECF subfamily)